ncbi:MAG: thiamine pyrophosphate-dependent enzyme [Anaerolineaceae bacterium]|nr:thiamine pyrophosphate-dependent enzyme [Anaerolineaceae bacterium]
MTKSIPIDPVEARRAATITAPDLPANAWRPDPAADAARYGSEGLLRIYRDMLYIRQFETMLEQIKREGAWGGIDCQHGGPAHLSIGQEAAAVGQCVHLEPEDFIFGSHRSHGEILAKSFSAIDKLPDARLLRIMETYMEGDVLRVVEGFTPASADLRQLALAFTLYGTLAEILGRATGFNKGMGGSMHAFFPPFGVMPNNAIVGASADIAVGAALFKRINRRKGIVIANIGDAAAGCGPVWEAMMFAAMDQYHTLWQLEPGGAPPVLFNFMNNFYGMGGQPQGETMGFGMLARMAMGVNPDAMHAERIDGFNPLAVADAIARKRATLEAGRGPVLLDTVTYRFAGHSPSDASAYRTREEIEMWRAQDPLASHAATLLEQGHCDQDALDALLDEAQEQLRRVLRAASSSDDSPRLHAAADVAGLMFSGGQRARMWQAEPDTLLPLEETRLRVTRHKQRFGLDEEGKPRSPLRALTFAEALFEALLLRFYDDPSLVAWGEENRDWGGAFGVYRGLTECLPHHRLFNSPISEGAIVGTAVGYALSGGRVVAELMYCDFMGRAGDEIFNQMAKWQAMSAGLLQMPLVLRVSVGMKYGAQHSQDWSSLVAHVPGLQVMFPATPHDAKGMLSLALQGTDPVVFFESQRLYTLTETLEPGGVPVAEYQLPLGEPALRREGEDLTILSVGATLYRALEAAEQLQERHDLAADVIDARFINPLNYGPILESVNKTGRIVLVSDACERGSFLHTMAANITQLAFDALDGPPAVVGARNWITPAAELEAMFFPQADWILDTIHERLLPLPGHQPTTCQSSDEILRRNRLGV